MGLLDNLDDPDKLAMVQMGLSLLAPKPYKTGLLGDIGLAGNQGLQTLVAAKQQERQNRQSDIQQLTAASQLLRQQEFARMAQAQASGQPYTPNPLAAQINSRLSELVAGPNLSKILGKPVDQSAPPPSAPPSAPPSPPPMGVAPPSPSPMANPGYNPPPAAVRPPTPQAPPSAPNASGLPPGFGGPAGGVPMAVWAAADPSGMAYLKQLAEDNKPVALRQGDLVARRPDGSYGSVYQQPPTIPGMLPSRDSSGQVTAFREAPGFAQGAANIKSTEAGATASAEDPHTMVQVTLADGRTIPVPRAALLGKSGMPPVAGLPSVTPPKPGVATVAVTDPGKSQEPAAQGDPWASIPTVKTQSGLGQTTYSAAIDKQRADKVARLSDEFDAAGSVANQRKATNMQALDLLNSADTGYFANHLAQFKSVLGSLGVKSASDDAATDQVLAKDLVNTALTRGKQLFGSRFTQGEVGIMLNTANPSPRAQATAIKFLLETDNATQDYALQKGNDFGRYLNQGGDPLQFSRWYDQKFPLSKSLEAIPHPGQSQSPGTVRRYNPQTGKIE